MSSPMQKTAGSRSIASQMPWRIASRYVTGAMFECPIQLRLTILSANLHHFGLVGCGADLSPGFSAAAGFFAGGGASFTSPPSMGDERKRSSSGSHVHALKSVIVVLLS